MEVEITGQSGCGLPDPPPPPKGLDGSASNPKGLSPITETSTPSDKEPSAQAAEPTSHALEPVQESAAEDRRPAAATPAPSAATPASRPAGPIHDTPSEHSGGGKTVKQMYVNDRPYSKIRLLGQGGSSKVYEVQDPSGRTFALKRVVASHSGFFTSFKNEVQLLRKLKGKPNIVQMHDAEIDEQNERIFIVMEFGETDLSRFLIAQTEPLSVDKIRHYWRQMLEAVRVIHAERIVHGDLKPANFLLVDSSVKLIDFGIAKSIAHEETTNIQRTQQVGTVSYMAPEAASLDPKRQAPIKYGRKSDVWSLGVILYQLIFRKTPFAHLSPVQRLYAIVDEKVDLNTPIPINCPALQDVMRICLHRDVEKRADLEELLAHEFILGGPSVARPVDESEVIEISKNEVAILASAVLKGLTAAPPTNEQQGFVHEIVWKAMKSKDFSSLESTLRSVTPRKETAVPQAKRVCRGPSRVAVETESKGVLASSARQIKLEEAQECAGAGAGKTGGALKDKLNARRSSERQ